MSVQYVLGISIYGLIIWFINLLIYAADVFRKHFVLINNNGFCRARNVSHIVRL